MRQLPGSRYHPDQRSAAGPAAPQRDGAATIASTEKTESLGEHLLLHVSAGLGGTFMAIRLHLYLLASHPPHESS